MSTPTVAPERSTVARSTPLRVWNSGHSGMDCFRPIGTQSESENRNSLITQSFDCFLETRDTVGHSGKRWRFDCFPRRDCFPLFGTQWSEVFNALSAKGLGRFIVGGWRICA